MVYSGRSYRIQSIENGQIQLALGNSRNPVGYTQIRRYSVEPALGSSSVNSRHFEAPLCNLVEGFTVQSGKTTVQVETLGCYEHCVSGKPFSVKKPFPIDINMKALEQARRSYNSASVLELSIRFTKAVASDKISFLLAVLMNEFSSTWFPYSKDCIAVCPVLNDPAVIEGDEVGKHLFKFYPQIKERQPCKDPEKQIRLLIIEDSMTDLGIVKSLTDNWREMFDRVFDNLREYLHWQQTYINKESDNFDNKFLYFGTENEPDCFDFKTLMETLNELVQQSDHEVAELLHSQESY